MRTIKTTVEKEKNNIDDTSIRPKSLDDYIGQEHIKENLKISLKAAKCRNTALDHFLLSGPPGLGKTSLAYVIANEMNSNIRCINAPVIEKTGDMASILASLEKNDILFIDEIHRLPKQIEEMLYSAMEDYKIEIIIGNMEQSKVVTMPLPKFTLIGATTREGLLSKPLLDRFQNQYKFDYYTDLELAKITQNTSKKYGITIKEKEAVLIGKVSRGTPRIANNYTKRISDFVIAADKALLTANMLIEAFKLFDIDEDGYTQLDRKYISVIKDTFQNKPVGLNTLAAYLGESEDTIKETIEPYLIRKGILLRTPSGRMIKE